MTQTPEKSDPQLTKAMTLHKAGRPAEAEPLYREAVAAHPKDGRYRYLLGLCLLSLGKYGEGRKVMAETVAMAPLHAGAHYALGRLLAHAGEDDQAKMHLIQAVTLGPTVAEHHVELGNLLAKKSDLQGAVSSFKSALLMAPQHPGIQANLATALYRLGERAEALALWNEALRRVPNLGFARLGLANDRRNRGDLAGAERELRLAAAAEPRNPQIRSSLGRLLRYRGDASAAIVELEAARALDPQSNDVIGELARCYQSICAWNDLDRLMPSIRAEFGKALAGQACGIPPFFTLALPASAEERAAVARIRAQQVSSQAAAEWRGMQPLTFSDRHRDPLIVGYLSSDLRDHAGGHLLASLFGVHRRDRVSVLAYSLGPDDGSRYRKKFEAEADRFIDLTDLNNVEAARRIHADGVDILVDINGLTAMARAEIAAMRPAPVQATWLSFPGTSGADFYDYVIVDQIVVPPESERYYAERLCRLPHSYQVNDRWPPELGPATTRAAEGLPEGATVFCSFCAAYKIERETFRLWMNILQRVPGSVLWLMSGPATELENLRAAAVDAGIAPERLIFAAHKPKPDHLARLALADLMLDTFTYGGHNTISDALAAGVPAVTRCGGDFPSRVGASLLNAVGLTDLIRPDIDMYETLAVELGSDRPAIDRIKAKLAAALPTAPLFDTDRFARNLERAYAEMWRIHRAGGPPRLIQIEDDETVPDGPDLAG
jgi:predicted O-linked N-acetylglucosamine transferase (SPINDLY family)